MCSGNFATHTYAQVCKPIYQSRRGVAQACDVSKPSISRLTCGKREAQGVCSILADDLNWVHHIPDGLTHLPPLPIPDLHNCHGSSEE